MRPKVVRLKGLADDLFVEFKYLNNDTWECTVPPDLKDGQYALFLEATNEIGEKTYYTGELYMTKRMCHLDILTPRYILKPNNQRYQVRQKNERFKIEIKKGCEHKSGHY